MISLNKTSRFKWLFLVTLIITAVLITAGDFFVKQSPEEIKGPYTYEQRIVEGDGNVAEVYASGDQYYNYLHDENGFILEKGTDGNLYYAVSDNGRPTPSNVRYNSPSYLVNSIEKMGYDDVDFASNVDLLNSYYETEEASLSQPLLTSEESTSTTKNVYNVVIFIRFLGTSDTVVEKALEDSLVLYGNNDDEPNSIRAYYNDMSGGQVVINNCFAYEDQTNTIPFVYNAGNYASYFQVDESASNATRLAKEKELLSGAVEAFNNQYKGSYVSGTDFDINDDGRFDSVCFVVLSQTSNLWGSLLWPHKFSGSGLGMDNTITIGGSTLKVGDYSFSFGYVSSGQYSTAVACHEMGHIFSAPDYYSYVTGVDYKFAGLLDLMGDTTSSTRYPSYMTAYTRNKYLGILNGPNQIRTVKSQQSITLTAATEATEEDTVAIKIPTNREGVYIMAEYRTNLSSSTYDNSIGGRGVIVYRVNENVYGNTAALTSINYSNIELYVYRGGRDISNAYLNNVGEYFTNFKINALNSLDVTIKVTSISSTKAVISITGADIAYREPVSDDYFLDKIDVKSAELVLDETNKTFGVNTVVTMSSDVDVQKLSTMSVKLVDSSGGETHKMTANRETLKTQIDQNNYDYSVTFDILSDGSDDWFYGGKLNDNTPVAVAIEVEDTDGDVIDVNTVGNNGRFAIDGKGYLWENVASVARYYDVYAMYLETPYIEVSRGDSFTVPSPIGRSGQNLPFSCTYSVGSGFSVVRDSGLVTVLDSASLGLHYVQYVHQSHFGEIKTTLTVNVINGTSPLFEEVSNDGTAVVIGSDWEDIGTKVNVGGAMVSISNTDRYSYDPYYYTKDGGTNQLEQEIKFYYNGKYYKTTINITDALMAAKLGEASFEFFSGRDELEENVSVTLYCLSGDYYNKHISDVTMTYDLSQFSGITYMPIAYDLSYDGMTISSQFNFMRVSTVAGSISAEEDSNKITVGGVTYYVGSMSSGVVTYQGLRINVSLYRGSGIETYVATYGGADFSIAGLPTETGDYPGVMVSIQYDDNGNIVDLGGINLNFRILKTATSLEVQVKGDATRVADLVSGGNLTRAFFIDEYDRGLFNFQYVIGFDDNTSQEVDFNLYSYASVKDGAFEFTSTEWGLDKTFYFYGVDVVASIDTPSTSYYGVTLPTSYNGKSYLGQDTTYAPTFSYNEKGSLKVSQNVDFSITYNSSNTTMLPYERTIIFSRSITVVDGVYEIKRVQLSSTVFLYEEQMSADNLELLTYLSYYNYYNGNVNVLSVAESSDVTYSILDYSGLVDNLREMPATLTVAYGDQTYTVAVTLQNGIVSRRILDPMTDGVIYKKVGESYVAYDLTYQNGSTERVTVYFGEHTLVDGVIFNCDEGNLGLQKLTIYNPNFEGEILTPNSPLKVFVYKQVTEVLGIYTPSGKELTPIPLKYGDILDLTGYKIKYKYGDTQGEMTLKHNYYTFATDKYSTFTETKVVVVTMAVLSVNPYRYEAKSYTVDVRVAARVDDEVLEVKSGETNVTIDHVKKLVILNNKMTKVALKDSLVSSSRFTLVYPTAWASGYAGGYEVVAGKKNVYKVMVINRDGTIIDSYQVILKGDGNGDGVSDLTDIESFAEALLNGGDDYVNVFANGKSFSINDLIKQILDRKNEGADTPLPMAEQFVCEYKSKEEEQC